MLGSPTALGRYYPGKGPIGEEGQEPPTVTECPKRRAMGILIARSSYTVLHAVFLVSYQGFLLRDQV